MVLLGFLNACLWRLGGDGCPPFKRQWRRIGYPVLLLVACILREISPLIAILVALLAHLTTRLPLTLTDSDVDSVKEFIWVFFLGFIYGLPSVLINGLDGLIYAIWSMLVTGLSLTLSNISGDMARVFKHEFCEAVIGFAIIQVILH